jgi:chromosome partitioning protein
MGKTIFVGARKGGAGKTMTTASLGFGLAREGKKVLCVDADSQHSLTVSLGVKEPEKLQATLATVMTDIINERSFNPADGILHHSEGVDFLPANSTLTGIELALAPLIGRETVLRQYVERVKVLYDYIIFDTAPGGCCRLYGAIRLQTVTFSSCAVEKAETGRNADGRNH